MFWKDATVEAITADLAVVHGPVEQGDPVLGACLGEHVADVIVHRSFADGETVSDFLIG